MRAALFATILISVAWAEPSPVPYSTDDSDGMPYDSDWKLFDTLHQQVLASKDMEQQRIELLTYASDQVRAALPEISENLQKLRVDGFDMIWPGDGFNGVAYGGLYEVLGQLEVYGVSRVGKRMGASGGACSTILTMAGTETFLKLYQVYQLYYDGHPERLAGEGLRDTGVTAAVYAEAARSKEVFANAQKNAFVTSKCSAASEGNTIFRGFRTLKQLVAAGYSSGDASVGGLAIGTYVDGASDVGHCADGGEPTIFPSDAASRKFGLLKYSTPIMSLTSTSFPTADSIDKLFRAGVNNGIAALKSPKLSARVAGGSIDGVLPGPSGIVTATEYRAALGEAPAVARDVDLAARGRGGGDVVV